MKRERSEMTAVIAAGGKGTRLSQAASRGIPKPMVEVCGRPVLEREIDALRAQGFTDIVITVSHLAGAITGYFGNGERHGINITYFCEEAPLGNAGALFKIKDRLSDDFLLVNADTVFDVDISRFASFHKACGGLATIFTHPNSHPFDSSLIVAGPDKEVMLWLGKDDERRRGDKFYKNRVNAGLHIISKALLDLAEARLAGEEKIDLDSHLLKPLARTGKLFCYDSPEYVKEMGTPERLEAVALDIEAGVPLARNLGNKQKAVFLDRDGTINRDVGFLRSADDFALLEGAAEAVKKINQSGRLAIVATNQPAVARGECSLEALEEIHNKMETLLGDEGAFIDGIYFCPHHPQSGFEGEVAELKIECGCRKPKPGMLLKAAEDFNIDLSQSWMVGDSPRDIEAGKAAGCKTALIGGGEGALFGQDANVQSLKDFADRYL